jgi:cytochrome P450
MIPIKKGLPFIGNLLAYQKDKLGFLQSMHRKHGDTFKIKIGSFTLTVVTHPEDIAHVMQTNANNYNKKSNIEYFFGKSIIFSNAETWKTHRKMLQPMFRNEKINSFIPVIDEICKTEFKQLVAGAEVDINEFYNDLSFKIITSTIIGNEFKQHSELKKHFKIVASGLTKQKFTQNLPFLFKTKDDEKESMEVINNIFIKIIADKKRSQVFNNDTLSLLVQHSQIEGSAMSDKDIRDQLVTLVYAGYETTALSMGFITHLLSLNVDYQSKLFEESKFLNESSPEEIAHFSGYEKLIKESLRLYPPGWAWTRIAVGTDQLRNHKVEKDEILFICPYLTQRDSSLWPMPEKFIPERFDKDVVKGSYIPFGFGPRTCIGMGLAMIEMNFMIKYLLHNFEVTSCNHQLKIAPQITLDVKNGFKVNLKKRPDKQALY